MEIWILTVFLLTTPDKIFHQQTLQSHEECVKWMNFYNEYPFRPVCERKNK